MRIRTDSAKKRQQKYIILQTVQWLVFAFLLFAAFITATAGSMVKPLLLLPLALCIASHTGEMQAMAVGTVSGLLLDIVMGKLVGYNAIWMVVSCVAVSLLYNYLLRQKLLNILALSALCTFVQGYLDYVFYYAIWEYEDVHLIYADVILPSCIYTVISTIPIYFIVKWIAKKCGCRRTHVLEKTTLISAYQD